MIRVGPEGAIVHRAGRSWRVQPGRPIQLLDGDVVEIDGRRLLVEMDDEDGPHHEWTGAGTRRAGAAAALALAAFLGLTAPASAETPAPPATARQPAQPAKATASSPGATGRITGKVLFVVSQKPAAGATVIARNQRGEEKSGETDAQGAFVLEGVEPGKYWVRVVRAGDVGNVKERPALVKAGTTVSVTLTAHRATARVFKLGGAPVPRPWQRPKEQQ